MDMLFVMDPPEQVHPGTDSTYALIRAAGARGHVAWVATPETVGLEGGTPVALAFPVEIPGPDAPLAPRGRARRLPVEAFPVTWLRPDPPFDVPYLELTWILDHVDRGRALIVNDPAGVRSTNEKLWALRFPELCPPTLVTADVARLRAFVEQAGEVVLKPIETAGGDGVLFAGKKMRGLAALLESATRDGRCLAQTYLPAAAGGDKRVLVLDGQPLGAVLRVHAKGEERNNLHLGGSAHRSELDAADRRIVQAIGPYLRAAGLLFVGIDVIDGKLIEVNVTSPTGLQELARLSGIDGADRAIALCEARAPAAADVGAPR